MTDELAAAINEAWRLTAKAQRGREQQQELEDAAVTAVAHVHDLLIEAQSTAFVEASGLRLADRLDDEAIDAADRFISRGRGGAA